MSARNDTPTASLGIRSLKSIGRRSPKIFKRSKSDAFDQLRKELIIPFHRIAMSANFFSERH